MKTYEWFCFVFKLLKLVKSIKLIYAGLDNLYWPHFNKQVMPPEKLKYHFYYKHHMQQVDKKHLCPLCGKSLTYAYQLQVHMAVHHKSEVDPNTGSLPTGSAKNLESEVMCDQVQKF